MKHNWEYKTIRSMCDKSPYRGAISSHDGKYWLLNLDKIASGEGKVTEYEYFHDSDILSGSVTAFGENYVLYSKLRPNLNKVVVTKDSGFCTSELIPLVPNNALNSYFLAYYLRSPIFLSYITGKVGGAKMPRAKMNEFWSYKIPVPPMDVQERIVTELDEINGMIEVKREQLKQLNLLAQSIFYTMFGDPVTNSKGWPVKQIREVAPSSSSPKTPEEKDGRFWLLNLDQIERNTGRVISKQFYESSDIGNSVTTFDNENILYSKLRPYLNKVVIPYSNGFCTSELIPLRPKKHVLNRFYCAHALRLPEFVRYISDKTGGAKMPRVKMDYFWQFKMPIPPLYVQEQFAKQTKAIERRKEDIEETVKELQLLLDSRMDYWFN